MSKYIPPWRTPYLVGISGCSGSGKTSISQEIIRRLNIPWAVLLSMDNFYKPLTPAQREQAFQSNYDFDDPKNIDFELFISVLTDLKAGKSCEIPVYSFSEHTRTSKTTRLYGANLVIVEGIYALHDKRVRDILDLKVFVHEELDVCMARRLHRDILYRGRVLDLSIKQWDRYVRPHYELHILPTSKYANFLFPKGLENHVGLDMLYHHLERHLQAMSKNHMEHLDNLGIEDSEQINFNQFELHSNGKQLKALETMIADKETNREDFIYAVNRMARALVTAGLDKLWKSKIGDISGQDICAVTMIRGGECFENALQRVIPHCSFGRCLIISDVVTGEPKLYLEKVSLSFNSASKVIITDGRVNSGCAAVMAIAIVVDHGFKQEDILFTCFGATEVGIKRIYEAFPQVNLLFGFISPLALTYDIDSRYFGS